MATANDKDGASKKLITYTRKKKFPSSVTSVLSIDDLLTEILLRLPVISLVLFKSVSKQWLSLIKDTTFICRHRSENPELDPPSGLLIQRINMLGHDFKSFDNRIPSRRSTVFALGHLEILQSCNGLLLCRTLSKKIYVYNPSINNMFKVIPEPDNVTFNPSFGGFRLAFDPTKSPHYKVFYAEPRPTIINIIIIRIHTYSSETGNWSVSKVQFPYSACFDDGIYWNDAIYWGYVSNNLYKLDIVNEQHAFTILQTPLTSHGKVHYERRLFESCGCLLLVGKDDVHSRHFTIYEKRNVSSEWSWKYKVNLDDIIKPFPERWSVHTTIFGIVLGEREEDSILVLKLDRKVVLHKIMSKTLCTIFNLGSDDNLVRCFQFIPSFADV